MLGKRRRSTPYGTYGTYRTPQHVSQFRHLFDLNRIENPKYHDALIHMRPLVHKNLIQLSKNELPFEVAFRVPEHDYLRISMGRDNLHGKPTHMSYVDDLFKIPPCTPTQSEFSCFLDYLYPQWYASDRKSAFGYINHQLDHTHYKQIPIASFKKLWFLRLNIPMDELKSRYKFNGTGFTWNDIMRTSDGILETLKTRSSVDELSKFIDEMVHPDNPNPIDATFIQTFNEACDRLNATPEEYLNIATKISICGKFYTEKELNDTNWYKKVHKMLNEKGIKSSINDVVDVHDDHAFVRAFVIAVAHVDIMTPLSLQYMILKFLNRATSTTHVTPSDLKQRLKELCSKNNVNQSDLTALVEELHANDNPDKKKRRIDSLMKICNSYNVLAEVETNKHNFGIMNTELTQSLIMFFKEWYLKEVSTHSGKRTTMIHALVNNVNYSDIVQSEDAQRQIASMESSYGKMFRYSEMGADFEFALCLNVLLTHLYSDLNVAGYYMGQIMCNNMYGDGMLTTMNAELTLTQMSNSDPTLNYKVRKVKTTENGGHETGTDSEGGRRRRKKTIKRKQKRNQGNKTKRN